MNNVTGFLSRGMCMAGIHIGEQKAVDIHCTLYGCDRDKEREREKNKEREREREREREFVCVKERGHEEAFSIRYFFSAISFLESLLSLYEDVFHQ